IPYWYFAHFRELDRLYYPSEFWGYTDFSPLPWPRIRRDFDYVLQAGDPDPRVDARIRPYAHELFRDGDITVYAPDAVAGPTRSVIARTVR
ncbi:MAG: hypothetical protein M3154_11710, partial [Candidatus Eremiobacteraeota bacterium]|nr:hypothetical protein [Candidatus Eremiobacteraeota bacterium]